MIEGRLTGVLRVLRHFHPCEWWVSWVFQAKEAVKMAAQTQNMS